jgi:hypothetical protein
MIEPWEAINIGWGKKPRIGEVRPAKKASLKRRNFDKPFISLRVESAGSFLFKTPVHKSVNTIDRFAGSSSRPPSNLILVNRTAFVKNVTPNIP